MTFDQSSITNTNTAAYAGSSGTYTGTSSGTYTGTSTTTGSWADSTHSVIWMTRGNVLRGMGLSRQPWGKRIASLVLIAAMMLLAQANLIDVYGGHLGDCRCTGHLAGRDHRSGGHVAGVATVVANRVSGVCPIHHRPGGNAEFHYVPLRDSHLEDLEFRLGNDVWLVQVHYFRRSASGHARRRADGGMDHRPVAYVLHRRVCH